MPQPINWQGLCHDQQCHGQLVDAFHSSGMPIGNTAFVSVKISVKNVSNEKIWQLNGQNMKW